MIRDTHTIHIMIRPDGTVHFGALPPELLEIAAELNPHDNDLAARLNLWRAAKSKIGDTQVTIHGA